MYYTLDLYNDSPYSNGLQVIWTSGTLLYGAHNITISQLGPDARFGCVHLHSVRSAGWLS